MACRRLWAPFPALQKINKPQEQKVLPRPTRPVLTHRRIPTCTPRQARYKPVTGTATLRNKDAPQHATVNRCEHKLSQVRSGTPQAILGKETEEWRMARSRKQGLCCPHTETKSVRSKELPFPERTGSTDSFCLGLVRKTAVT